jgi:transcriptional regulator with XRE-family HTH domain
MKQREKTLKERRELLRDEDGDPITQEKMARTIGVMLNTYWKWEKANRIPSKEMRKRFAAIESGFSARKK